MIQFRHQQRSVWEGLFAEEVAELWEPWMRVVDELLEDEELVDAVYKAQGQRHGQSRTSGRPQTPAEVALRMLILKHVRNWSYETLEREVRANVVYRSFCRIGMQKVPDAKTLVRLGQAIGPETVRELHDRIVALAQKRRVIRGREDASGHDGGREQHTLPDGQRLAERWRPCADADDEKDRAENGRAQAKSSQPDAQRDQASHCHRACPAPQATEGYKKRRIRSSLITL